MKLSDSAGAVASFHFEESDLCILRRRAKEVGQELNEYVIRGLECALALAIKLESDRLALDAAAAKEQERIEFRKASMELQQALRDRAANPTQRMRRYGSGKRRDVWGNLKKDPPSNPVIDVSR